MDSIIARSSVTQAILIYLFTQISRVLNDSSECFNCYSLSPGGCDDPLAGRYLPNSSILIPDCSYNMARSFHTTVLYVMTYDSNETVISMVESIFVKAWNNLQSTKGFFCCKTIVTVSMGTKDRKYVIRGCCYFPNIYNQCEEIDLIQSSVANAEKYIKNKVDYCSVCDGDRCNVSKMLLSNANTVMSLFCFVFFVQNFSL